MLLAALFAACAGAMLVLLFLLLGRSRPVPVTVIRPPRDLRPRISPPTFRAVVIDLLGKLGLDVVEEELRGAERRLVAVRDGMPEAGRCVVFVESAPPGDLVEGLLVDELAASVRGESGAVGLLVTPYRIEPTGPASGDAPVELVDGVKLRRLVATYLPERLAELDGYWGFGSLVAVG
jgi:hypothetical protein